MLNNLINYFKAIPEKFTIITHQEIPEINLAASVALVEIKGMLNILVELGSNLLTIKEPTFDVTLLHEEGTSTEDAFTAQLYLEKWDMWLEIEYDEDEIRVKITNLPTICYCGYCNHKGKDVLVFRACHECDSATCVEILIDNEGLCEECKKGE